MSQVSFVERASGRVDVVARATVDDIPLSQDPVRRAMQLHTIALRTPDYDKPDPDADYASIGCLSPERYQLLCKQAERWPDSQTVANLRKCEERWVERQEQARLLRDKGPRVLKCEEDLRRAQERRTWAEHSLKDARANVEKALARVAEAEAAVQSAAARVAEAELALEAARADPFPPQPPPAPVIDVSTLGGDAAEVVCDFPSRLAICRTHRIRIRPALVPALASRLSELGVSPERLTGYSYILGEAPLTSYTNDGQPIFGKAGSWPLEATAQAILAELSPHLAEERERQAVAEREKQARQLQMQREREQQAGWVQSLVEQVKQALRGTEAGGGN